MAVASVQLKAPKLFDFKQPDNWKNLLSTSRSLQGSPKRTSRDKSVRVIVIARVPGIYGSKRTESEGAARGQGLFMLP